MKVRMFIFSLLLLTQLHAQRYNQFVNPFIGTEGTGHTFPGPSMPFGMVQPGPDNRDFGWNHTSGYQYSDTFLMGFSQTHFSGTGINEMGDILLLPINPSSKIGKNAYFKSSEKARLGYYSVTKKDNVKTELTCSNRVAFHQYTFPEKKARVFLNFQHGLRFVFDEKDTNGLVVSSSISIENSNTISGYCTTKNWVNRTYYFIIEFSQPIVNAVLLESVKNEKAPKYNLDFLLEEDKKLKVKIALSTVDVNGAKQNLQSEIDHWNFNQVVRENQTAWDTYLSRIDISATKKQKEIFYTSLYHLLLQPSNIADVDGRYRGADNVVMLAKNHEYYATLSIWDIYRGAFPLLQIVAPERIDGIVRTLIAHHRAAGFLPIWTAWGQDNYCMIGNHAIPMILSAYENGFRGFDPREALTAMIETSTRSHINSQWELYNQYGYYPFDKLDNESVSRTLESGYDDWCVSAMANKLNLNEQAAIFKRRAGYYKNLFDPETSFFRGKDSIGRWRSPFNPSVATSPLNNPGDYTEANAWQYFWTPAQHDVSGLMTLLGGEKAFALKLDTFFTTTSDNPSKFLGQEAMIGQYAHGNEPSHHIVYLYAFTDEFKKGQQLIHRIIQDFHNNTPDGMIGNDDCGQMSAWYILSTLGFYPVNAADGTFVLGSPQVKNATIHLPNQKSFRIKAKNFSRKNIYQIAPRLNETKLERNHVLYSELMMGGLLEFQMTNH